MANEEETRKRILIDLIPLFNQARREGLWFHCAYQDLWFTPDDLEAAQANGRFLWGAVNWKLVRPEAYTLHMQELAAKAARVAELAEIRAKLAELNGGKV